MQSNWGPCAAFAARVPLACAHASNSQQLLPERGATWRNAACTSPLRLHGLMVITLACTPNPSPGLGAGWAGQRSGAGSAGCLCADAAHNVHVSHGCGRHGNHARHEQVRSRVCSCAVQNGLGRPNCWCPAGRPEAVADVLALPGSCDHLPSSLPWSCLSVYSAASWRRMRTSRASTLGCCACYNLSLLLQFVLTRFVLQPAGGGCRRKGQVRAAAGRPAAHHEARVPGALPGQPARHHEVGTATMLEY